MPHFLPFDPEPVLIVFFVVVLPIWLSLHYGAKFRQTKLLTQESERALAELADLADRLEARIATLERLLEASAGPERRKP